MDYKYIEQLLERYWECQTSLEEEEILQAFFTQENVPAPLLPYRPFFAGMKTLGKEHLGADFDAKVLAQTIGRANSHTVKAAPLSKTYRLRPFFQAAACVAIVLCLGMAVQQASTLRNDTSAEIVKTNSQQISPSALPGTAYGNVEALPADTTHLPISDIGLGNPK